jgi:Ribonuclease G/E
MSTNAEYVARMKAQLKKWDADFDTLVAQGDKARATAYKEGVSTLRAKRDAAQKAIEEIRFAGETAGSKMQAGMETTWEAMREALAKVSSDLRK